MSLWLILTAMIAVAAVFAAAPFIRSYERKRIEREKTLGIYRDQLKEVDIEASTGAIDAAQAEASRAEIKRRLIAASADASTVRPGMSSGEKSFAAIVATIVVVMGSVALFALTADLEPVSKPSLASVAPMPSATVARSGAAVTPPPLSVGTTPAATPAALGNLPSVDDLIQRLVTRLDKNPKDVEGWRMLGWSYFGMNRFDEAAKAYARAIELNPNSAEYRDGRIESLVRAANGKVNADALTLVDDTLKIHPRDSRALFVKAVAIEQGGDRAGAEAIWNDMLRGLDPGDPWVKEIKKKLGGAPAEDAVLDKVQPVPQPTPGLDAAPIGEAKGPTADQVRAADTMAPADRSAMIRQMVGSLADRLEKSPHDAEGWTRLIRSWMVLGETEKAQLALNSALKAFADDPEQMRRLSASAQEAGLKP